MLLLLLACAATPADTTCPPGSHREADGLCHLDEDDGGGEDGPAQPQLDADEALAALEAGLALGIPEPFSLHAAYEERLTHGEPDCPVVNPPEAADAEGGVWVADCTTSTGWLFQGESMFIVQGDEAELQLDHAANYRIDDPDGARFVGGGAAGLRRESDGEGFSFEGTIGGSFHQDGGEGWLGASEGQGLLFHGGGDASGTTLSLSGGVHLGDHQLDFVQVQLDPAVCAGPLGTVGLRDPTGWWYSLELGEACDGCGRLWFDGQDLGEACLDQLQPALVALVDAVEAG